MQTGNEAESGEMNNPGRITFWTALCLDRFRVFLRSCTVQNGRNLPHCRLGHVQKPLGGSLCDQSPTPQDKTGKYCNFLKF